MAGSPKCADDCTCMRHPRNRVGDYQPPRVRRAQKGKKKLPETAKDRRAKEILEGPRPDGRAGKSQVIHKYQPHGTALEAFRSRDPEVLYAGPAGTGKSRACLEKVHMMALLNPGMRALLVRKTQTSLSSTGLVTFREHVCKEHLETGEVKWYGGSPQEPPAYRYKNGSVVVVGGMDKAMKVMSSEYDLVYVQEATELSETDWEMITTRLRNGKVSFQQLLADANPDVPTHWLKVRCDAGKTTMIESRHEDNPVLFSPKTKKITEAGKAYMSKLDALSGVRYMRLRKGVWCAAEGLVYEEWDPGLNKYKRINRPPISWTRYITIDFGYTNPFVAQFWAEDEDGRLYLYKELYQTKATVDEMAPKIKEAMNLKHEPRPRMIICDHDAEGRAVLERELGMSTRAAKKSVEDGIQAVKRRLRPSEVDGKPRLYLCEDALIERDQELYEARKPTCTLDEIVGYIWDQGGAKQQQDGKPPKEVPLKKDDHGMDALRYMVAELDLRSRPRIRTITY